MDKFALVVLCVVGIIMDIGVAKSHTGLTKRQHILISKDLGNIKLQIGDRVGVDYLDYKVECAVLFHFPIAGEIVYYLEVVHLPRSCGIDIRFGCYSLLRQPHVLNLKKKIFIP